jgi:hypothetical protein
MAVIAPTVDIAGIPAIVAIGAMQGDRLFDSQGCTVLAFGIDAATHTLLLPPGHTLSDVSTSQFTLFSPVGVPVGAMPHLEQISIHAAATGFSATAFLLLVKLTLKVARLSNRRVL